MVMVPQMGEKIGEIEVLEGNQGRSAGATTRGEVAVPAGNAGGGLRARGGGKRAEKRLGGAGRPKKKGVRIWDTKISLFPKN